MTKPESKRRVLFVCTQNKVRSLTAEHLYRVRPDLEVRSCGTATFAKNQLTAELLEWAEAVFTFDSTQMEVIEQRFASVASGKPVICLGLPDIFTYKSDPLVIKLTAKLEPYIGRPNATKCPPRSVFHKAAKKRDPSAETQSGKSSSLVSNLLTAVGVRRRKSGPSR